MFDSSIVLRSRSWTPLGVIVARLFTLRLAERLRLQARRGGVGGCTETARYAGMAYEEMWLVARTRDEDRLRRAIEWEAEILLRHGIDWALSDGPIPPTWPDLIPVSSNSLAAEYCGVDGRGRFVLGFDGAVRVLAESSFPGRSSPSSPSSPGGAGSADPGERVWTSTLFTFDEEGALIDAAIELFPEESMGDEGSLPPECRHLDRQIAARGYSPRDTIVIRPFTLEVEGLRFGFDRRTDANGCGYTVLPGGKQLRLPHLQVWFG